jgi:hypothetical protein
VLAIVGQWHTACNFQPRHMRVRKSSTTGLVGKGQCNNRAGCAPRVRHVAGVIYLEGFLCHAGSFSYCPCLCQDRGWCLGELWLRLRSWIAEWSRQATVVVQVLLRWSGLPSSCATWEYFTVAKNRFPKALARGQASFQGGRIVTTLSGMHRFRQGNKRARRRIERLE